MSNDMMRINISQLQAWALIFFTVAFLQIPIRIPIPTTELIWPNFWIFPLVATALSLTHWKISKFALSHIFVYTIVLALSTQLGYQEIVETGERLKSIPLAVAYFSTFLLLAELRHTLLDRRKLGHYFHIAAGLLLLFSLIEIFSAPIREFSNSICGILYGTFYSSDARDLSFAGFIRPKAFAYEPSHNAFTITVLSILGGFCKNKRKDHIKSLILCILAFTIVVSPLVFGLAAIYVFSNFHMLSPKLKKGVTAILFASIALAIVSIALVNFHEPTRNRIDNILTGQDGSIKMRTVNQVIFAAESLKLSPLFGVGIGGEGEIENEIRGLYLFKWKRGNFVQTLMLSPLFTLITFTGLAGLSWLSFSQFSISKKYLPHDYQNYLIVAFGFLLFSGSIITTGVWIVLGLILGCSEKAGSSIDTHSVQIENRVTTV